MQSNPKSTKVEVRKGDRISIRAEGSVTWAAWGNIFSGPDGLPNQGLWNEFNCGTLIARIGDDDHYIKIGSRAEFVAERPGVLYLAIAMQDSYATNTTYAWPGDYKTRITIKSGP
jgi:hypothetical protein